MGLAQNLKKILSNTASKILAELSSVFIRRRAKLILRKQDNSSTTTSSQKSLTQESQGTTIATSSAGTTEKITMENLTTEELVSDIRTWAIDKFNETELDAPLGDAAALYQEFAEWIEPVEEELEIVSLDEITKEQYNEFVDYMNDKA